MKIICLVLLSLVCLNSTAQWSQDSRTLLEKYQSPFDDGIISTIWGNITKIQYSNPPEKNKINLQKMNFESGEFYKGKLPYLTGEKKGMGAAPLLVFNPGIFGNIKGPQSKDILSRFVNLGYRVINFPNPLSTDYAKQGPKFELLDMEKVAHIHLELVRKKIRQWEKEGKIRRPYLLGGLSFGSFISAVMYAEDAEKGLDVFDHYIGLSPPMDFIQSVENLDELIEETNDSRVGENYWLLAKVFFRIRALDAGEGHSKRNAREAKELMAQHVFKNNLIKSMKKYQKFLDHPILPKDKNEFKKWKRKFRFDKSFAKFAPKAFEDMQKTPGHDLAHWLSRARKAGKESFRLLSCQDDPINKEIDLRIGSYDQILALPHCGHIGYRSLKWFDELIQAEFSLPTP